MIPKLTAKNLALILKMNKPMAKAVYEWSKVEKPEKFLDKMNHILGGFGVEYIQHPRETSLGLAYINMGDTYEDTIMYDYYTDRFLVGSWGDWVEMRERRFGSFD